MEPNSSLEPIEKETKAVSAEDISVGKKSRKTAKRITDLDILLRIIQQSVYDYQQAGGKIVMPDVGNVGTAIVFPGVKVDNVGNLLRETANISVGIVGND